MSNNALVNYALVLPLFWKFLNRHIFAAI